LPGDRARAAPVRAQEPIPTHPARAATAPPAHDEAATLTADLRRLHVTVSARFLEKLARARSGLSHALPGATTEQVLEAALDLLLERQARAKALVKRPRAMRPVAVSDPAVAVGARSPAPPAAPAGSREHRQLGRQRRRWPRRSRRHGPRAAPHPRRRRARGPAPRPRAVPAPAGRRRHLRLHLVGRAGPRRPARPRRRDHRRQPAVPLPRRRPARGAEGARPDGGGEEAMAWAALGAPSRGADAGRRELRTDRWRGGAAEATRGRPDPSGCRNEGFSQGWTRTARWR